MRTPCVIRIPWLVLAVVNVYKPISMTTPPFIRTSLYPKGVIPTFYIWVMGGAWTQGVGGDMWEGGNNLSTQLLNSWPWAVIVQDIRSQVAQIHPYCTETSALRWGRWHNNMCTLHNTLYSRKFLWVKYFIKLTYLCIPETFHEIYFCQCGEDCHIVYVYYVQV